MDEVFERGREQVLLLAEAGVTDVDTSYFLEEDTVTEPPISRITSVAAESPPPSRGLEKGN